MTKKEKKKFEKHVEVVALFTKNNRLPTGVKLASQRKEGL
jgi:hypothetical protein